MKITKSISKNSLTCYLSKSVRIRGKSTTIMAENAEIVPGIRRQSRSGTGDRLLRRSGICFFRTFTISWACERSAAKLR